MPSQLLWHLSCTARQPLAQMFQRVALEGVPTQWKTVSVTPVFNKRKSHEQPQTIAQLP